VPGIAALTKVAAGAYPARRHYDGTKFFVLYDPDGSFISDLDAVTSITYQAASCDTFEPIAGSPVVAAESPGHSALAYDSTTNIYHVNWKTPRDSGCYVLSLTLDTGQVFQANFDL
jgi:hypothetical protein